MAQDNRIDIRDEAATQAALISAKPNVVIHLAAQPLVRASYEDPQETYSTNVMGTMNVLNAIARTDSVQASLIIKTDKMYLNVNKLTGYKEDVPLGGDDPYSASRAMADIRTQSWVKSFDSPPTAITRAGNVIGGDTSQDRLIPNLISAFTNNMPARIRYPQAVRPWQHVLDCLNGNQLLVESLLSEGRTGDWNFGPPEVSVISIAEVANLKARSWGHGATWSSDGAEHPHEAALLTLNSNKSRMELGWKDKLTASEEIQWTVDSETERANGKLAWQICNNQIDTFLSSTYPGNFGTIGRFRNSISFNISARPTFAKSSFQLTCLS